MARPRRPIKKSANIRIRVEPGEKLTIQQNAREVAMHLSTFMLHRALRIPIRPKYDDRMIHRLDRAAGLVKKIGICCVRRDERGRFWAVLKDMRRTVAAINAVVTRELELPKVIGTELRNLMKATDELESALAQMPIPEAGENWEALSHTRERAAAIRGSAELISVAYQRELNKIIAEEQVDPMLDQLLDYVVIAAGLKQDILAAHEAGQSARQIAYALKTTKSIELPLSAIELVINTAKEVALQC